MTNPPKGALIGDDTRDKWLAFLSRAFELGYITKPEFDVKSQVVLEARTADDINPVLREFTRSDVEAWSARWKPALPSLFSPPEPPVHQDVSPPPIPVRPVFTRWAPVIMTTLAAIMIFIIICIEVTR